MADNPFPAIMGRVCYGACPDNAVVKTGPGGLGDYETDYGYCKGCGICAAECPAGAIAMARSSPDRVVGPRARYE
jgi:Pyruvate/2-oxoacid:ferredoxin oxidoreductase delta subunit